MVMLWEHLKSFWWFEHKGNRTWLWTPILLKKTYLFSVLYTGTPYKSKIATEQLKKKKKKNYCANYGTTYFSGEVPFKC